MKVLKVLIEVLGIFLRRHPVDPRRAILPRPAMRLPEEVHVNQLPQRREDVVWIVNCLLRNSLKFC